MYLSRRFIFSNRFLSVSFCVSDILRDLWRHQLLQHLDGWIKMNIIFKKLLFPLLLFLLCLLLLTHQPTHPTQLKYTLWLSTVSGLVNHKQTWNSLYFFREPKLAIYWHPQNFFDFPPNLAWYFMLLKHKFMIKC